MNWLQSKEDDPRMKQSGRKNSPLLRKVSVLCSVQIFSWLDEAQPPGEGQAALLSLGIEYSLSSQNPLHRNIQENIWQDNWALCAPVKLMYKLTITPLLQINWQALS